MKMTDRITLSPEDIILQLEQLLDSFRRFRYDGRYRNLLSDVIIDHMEKWDNNIRARRRDPFTIVVAGEFKRGKSSFINALLGENIMPTDITPETVTMNFLNYGAHKNEAVLSGGRRLMLSDDELTRSAIERISREVGEQIRRLEIYRPNEYLKDIRIVDTPGTNDSPDELDGIISDALAQADAVIYMYSVEAPLSRGEQLYLKYTILPQRYTKLLLVGNRGDLLNTEENLEKIKELIRKRTENILPNEKEYIISALDELCKAFGNDRPCPQLTGALEEGFAQLRDDLTELIEEKKTGVTADRMLRMTRMMVAEIENDLKNIEKGLEMSSAQVAEEKRRLENEQNNQMETLRQAQDTVSSSIDNMKSDALKWTEKLLRKIEDEDISGFEFQDLLQYYSYYCIELLQKAIMECLEYHREELLEDMSNLSDEIVKNLAGTYMSGNAAQFSMRLDSNTWTRGDSITLAISQVGQNSLLSAFADLAGSFVRKTELEADKKTLLDNIKSQYAGLHKDVRRNIDIQYSALNRSADNLLKEYYQDQIEYAKGAVEQYEEVSQKSGEDKVKITQVINEIRESLNAFKKNEEIEQE